MNKAKKEGEVGQMLTVWTSTLVRAIATSQYIPKRKLHLRVLDEIDAGTCTGMTYDEIAEKMPEEYAARAADKLVRESLRVFLFALCLIFSN